MREFPRPWSWPQGIHSTCISLRPGLWLWGDGCHVPGSRGGGGCWGGFGRQSAGGHGDTEVEKLVRVKGVKKLKPSGLEVVRTQSQKRIPSLYFSNDLFLSVLEGVFPVFNLFFLSLDLKISSHPSSWMVLGVQGFDGRCVFWGFLQGLFVFCWKGREAHLVLQNFGGIWETFYFFFGVRVKWHGEILFFFPKISPFYKAVGREVRTIYIHFRFWLETHPRNMLASDGPFRPFKQEQFQFLGGDAFMYLQKWPLGLSLRDGARVCCAGFVVEGSLSIKPKYQAHHTAFPAEILEMVEILGDKFLPTVRNS